MYFDPSCATEYLQCLLEANGATAEVLFRRVDASTSAAAHPMYAERREVDTTYRTWLVKGVVDEKPRKNMVGRGGGEIDIDIEVQIYDMTAIGGTEQGSEYEPRYQDQIVFRDFTYEVNRVGDINPSGASSRMAVRVEGTKYR